MMRFVLGIALLSDAYAGRGNEVTAIKEISVQIASNHDRISRALDSLK
jgi:hypothetical protein